METDTTKREDLRKRLSLKLSSMRNSRIRGKHEPDKQVQKLSSVLEDEDLDINSKVKIIKGLISKSELYNIYSKIKDNSNISENLKDDIKTIIDDYDLS
jgi:hypothetical protein